MECKILLTYITAERDSYMELGNTNPHKSYLLSRKWKFLPERCKKNNASKNLLDIGELLTALSDCPTDCQVTVLPVHVMSSTSTVVTNPYTKVLHCGGRVIINLIEKSWCLKNLSNPSEHFKLPLGYFGRRWKYYYGDFRKVKSLMKKFMTGH